MTVHDNPDYTPQGSAEYFHKMGNVHAARAAAERRLKEAHAEELERYMQEERVARGLPPHRAPKGPRYLELVARVAELEAELAKVKSQ